MKDLIEGIKLLNIPTKAAIALIGLFFVLQIIGELLEFKGKMVPEFIKVRKYFIRKKKERETLSKMTEMLSTFQEVPDTLKNVQGLLYNVDCHYNTDNIGMRDEWMKNVNNKLEENDKSIKELNQKLDKNNELTLDLYINMNRNRIIDFASKVANEHAAVSREEFNRIFKIYDLYEEILEKHGKTNGEVDISMRIIREAYKNHMKTHTFIEDLRKYSDK